MSTNDNFDSKKIMEDIDGLENDSKSKKVSFKIKFLNFIETSIFVVLMGIVIFVVLYSCLEALIEDDSDYNYDYSSSSLYYDDYTYNDYSDYKNLNNTTYNDINKNITANITLEEFLKTDIGNRILSNTTTTNTIANESATENTVASEEILKQPEAITEEPEKEYKTEEELKQELEEQKKNLIIKEEGKSINNELIVSIENKNTDLVFDLFVYAVFYKDGKIIAVDVQEASIILKDSKKYLKIEKTPLEYDNYEIFITKFDVMNFGDTIINEDVVLIPFIEKDNVKVKIINNSNKKINKAEMTIIYYDSNGKILEIDDAIKYNIWKSLNGETIGYGVWDESQKEYIQYSDYKVILDAAIHYE